jgi:hypothetical protein
MTSSLPIGLHVSIRQLVYGGGIPPQLLRNINSHPQPGGGMPPQPLRRVNHY